jgi:hypothetical protein
MTVGHSGKDVVYLTEPEQLTTPRKLIVFAWDAVEVRWTDVFRVQIVVNLHRQDSSQQITFVSVEQVLGEEQDILTYLYSLAIPNDILLVRSSLVQRHSDHPIRHVECQGWIGDDQGSWVVCRNLGEIDSTGNLAVRR